MAPNEVFARLVLSELSSKDRPLVWNGSIDFDAIEEFEAYASSGERALINLFWAAWRCEGIAEVFGRCDVATSRMVFGGLITAYAGHFGLDVTVSAANAGDALLAALEPFGVPA